MRKILLAASFIAIFLNGCDNTGGRITAGYDSLGIALDLKASDDYLYIADVEAGFVVLDIIYRNDPRMAASEPTHGIARTVAIKGNYALVGTDGGIDIFDIRDPYHPYFVSFYDIGSPVNSIEIYGRYAVVSTSSTVSLLDISDPQSIYLLAEFTYSSRATHTLNDTIYIANDDIKRVDITSIDSPIILEKIRTDGYAMDVYRWGDYLFVADGYRGLKVFDMSVPDSIHLLSRLDTQGEARDIEFVATSSHRYILLADLDGGLRVIDVTDPSSPVEIEQFDIPGNAYAVDYEQGYAYVAAGSEGIRIVRLSLDY